MSLTTSARDLWHRWIISAQEREAEQALREATARLACASDKLTRSTGDLSCAVERLESAVKPDGLS